MSSFRNKVLDVVNTVPKGKVVSYGQVALLAGVPRAARQVGNILCHFGETTPWWRVINNAGRISTVGHEHGLLNQEDYLRKEGVEVDEKLRIDIEKFRWRPNQETINKLELEDEKVEEVMEKFFS